ncbi:MAG: LysR family transcriptional regulator [Planctomycetota bacterium]
MNIEALRVFCEVARQRSFTRAASALHLTQPAASMAVQQLEKELGRQLVDRSRRPPQLTTAGDRFFAGCREILEILDNTLAQMHELDDEIAGPVHVASIYSVGLYHTSAIRHFMELYPKAMVRLQYLRPNLVVQAVLEGDATLGLVSYPKENRELAVLPWKEEEMVLVCPPTHRLASQKTATLEALSGENFIAFDSDLVIRKQVDAALHRHKAGVSVAMEFDNIETMKQAVSVGAGITILPEATVMQEVQEGSLAAVHLNPPELVRPVGVIYRKDKPLSLVATKFIELLAGSTLEQARSNRAAETLSNDGPTARRAKQGSATGPRILARTDKIHVQELSIPAEEG